MIDPRIQEVLRLVCAARRAVALARDWEAREALLGNVDIAGDTIAALVADLGRMERRAAALIGNGVTTDDGGRIEVALCDRRAKPRPLFVFRRGNLETTIFGRVA